MHLQAVTYLMVVLGVFLLIFWLVVVQPYHETHDHYESVEGHVLASTFLYNQGCEYTPWICVPCSVAQHFKQCLNVTQASSESIQVCSFNQTCVTPIHNETWFQLGLQVKCTDESGQIFEVFLHEYRTWFRVVCSFRSRCISMLTLDNLLKLYRPRLQGQDQEPWTTEKPSNWDLMAHNEAAMFILIFWCLLFGAPCMVYLVVLYVICCESLENKCCVVDRPDSNEISNVTFDD